MALDSSGNPKVDFAWGNAPLQPNDDRTVPGVNGYFTSVDNNGSVWFFNGVVDGLEVGDTFFVTQHLNPDFNTDYMVESINGDTVYTYSNFQTSGVWGNGFGCRWDKAVDNQQVVTTIGGGEGDYGWSSTQTKTSLELDPALDNHVLATGDGEQNPGYAGYPGFLANDPDNVPNTVVPDLSNATLAQATALLTNANLVLGTSQDDEEGATDGNDGTVKTQSYLPGAVVNEGTVVDITLYHVHLYTISFNANGGSGSQNSLTVRATTASFVLPAVTYTRSNYSFVGWSTNGQAAEGEALLAGTTVQSVSEDTTYYAIWHALLPSVTGGNSVSTAGDGFTYRLFTSSADLTVSGSPLNCEVLLVGGGASSGGYAGGAGAGGVLYATEITLPAGAHTVTIGAGGGTGGANGGNTSINPDLTSLIAVGGGRGGNYFEAGQDGGSGGGACGSGYPGGNPTAGQGNKGGDSFFFYGYGGRPYNGGGGGAGSQGLNGQGNTGGSCCGSQGNYGRGGNGTNSYDSWLSIFSAGVDEGGVRYIAGGGGGFSNQGSGLSYGGLGGGGNGCNILSAGVVNTGSGGGSAGSEGANGGSGLLIIRYLTASAAN